MISHKDKMLITGASGLLGSNLAYYFKDKFEILGLYHSHQVKIDGIFAESCNIAKQKEVSSIIGEFAPDIIVHCASLTNVDECEVERKKTRIVNVEATENIVNAIKDEAVYLIYISSDSVYDGSTGNFKENGNIDPKNNYGITKYDGELFVTKWTNGLVLRTNIFGWNIQDKKSLAEWILYSLQVNTKINGFKDVFFSSIYTMELARIINLAIHKQLTGIYNCGSIDSCSKYEFALQIADWFGLDRSLIKSISIDDFNFKAERGKNLSLNVNKLQRALDYKLPTINHSIEQFYRDYKSGLSSEIKKHSDEINKHADNIPYGRQWIDSNDVRSVVEVLRSDRITPGGQINAFEDELSTICNAKYAVAVNSGTSALHIACLSAGIAPGDEIITSPITFVASANCGAYCGAKPVFSDIDPKTYNISPEEIDKRITEKTKAVIPVHFAGQSCDMELIRKIVRKAEIKYNHKIFIIEDASHALGSKYKEKVVGSCTFADMTTMSFHPVKHITTGEGGVVLTNKENLYKKLRRFRSHGITSTLEEFVYNDLAFRVSPGNNQPLVNPWYYEQVDLGYNYRITDLQCALGLSQLKKLKQFCKRRRDIVNIYNKAFGGYKSIQVPYESEDCDSNFHLYVLLFDFDQIEMTRAQFMSELKKSGIQTQVHYIPVYSQPFYQENFSTAWGDCPNAENYYLSCLSIPLFQSMTEQQVSSVIKEITRIVRGVL
jgi:UDP-4-amino-4,6-dideoxy-N-acetyl-beta-L-altrosamine transaminase/dTDP-4-dehydrorhamnose reductase